METGSRIKYHRKKQQLELSDLAADIMSSIELKKIELGEISPSENDLKAICKKLKIPFTPVENPIGQELIAQFKELLLHPQDKRRIREHYYMIAQHPLLNIDEEIELEYQIQLIRFFVVTGDLESAEEKIEELDPFKEFMNQEQYYLYHKYRGNMNYMLSNYDSALSFYLLAEKIAPATLHITDCGDLYYSIAITAAQLQKNEISDKYSRMALAIYEEEFIPKRIVECHINLGITQQRLKNLRSALHHLKIALKIGKKLDNDILSYTTEFNIGFFYFLFEQYDLSIEHFKSSLNYLPKEYVADILATYCMLIKCSIAKENDKETKIWLNKGQALIDENDISLDSSPNNKFSEAYIEFRSLKSLIEQNHSEFEHMLTKYLLPVLKAENNYPELGYYYSILGNTYFKLGKYKKSAIILNEAQRAYKKYVDYT